MNKHYTFQEWLEECQSFQDTYEKYFEMQKELENLNEKLSLALESAEKRIDEAIETINYYAIENDDYSKIYNTEEKEIIKILKGVKNMTIIESSNNNDKIILETKDEESQMIKTLQERLDLIKKLCDDNMLSNLDDVSISMLLVTIYDVCDGKLGFLPLLEIGENNE